MSTKKLSRTVIEPGRTAFMKAARKDRNSSERSAARILGRVLARDPDRLDRAIFPRRRPLRVSQRDKLAPLERWLRKQKDRPWGEVYSEIKSRCDVRTTPGRHILYDHLLRDVEGNGISAEYPNRWRSEWRERFYVDDEGILRYVPAKKRPRSAYWWTDPAARAAEAFVAGRRVRGLGDVFFWMVAVNACALCTVRCAHLRFRQDRRLGEAEAATWQELPETAREPHVWKASGSE